MSRHCGVILLSLLFFSGCHSVRNPAAPDKTYTEAAAMLEQVIREEMKDKGLPAVSIALVKDQEIVWAEGFGYEDAAQKRPATAETIYRVGSVSKLFTDIAVMQLAEQGKVDLDAPVERYLPGFRPGNPFGKVITLRQLMAHRSGLVREPPAGHYFDAGSPTLAQTVESLNRTTLVYEPEKRTKYSNAGIAVVGYVLEKLQGKPFNECLRQSVLQPLGMRNTSFVPEPAMQGRLAEGVMWGYDWRSFPAPIFELGMAPAGSMYTSVLDLGRFMSAIFNNGKGAGGQVIKPESLEAMWTPQFSGNYGLGFNISRLDGRKEIGHGGAIYGFATQLHMLPEEKLGAVAVTTLDGANDVMQRIARYALRLMLAVQNKQPLPVWPKTRPADPVLARKLDGRYEGEGGTLELVERDGRLDLWQDGFRTELKTLGDTLIADGRLAYGARLLPAGEGRLLVNGREYRKQASPEPPQVPAPWRGLIGEYGWDHNVLFILEKEGRLHALIEWFFLYPLEALGMDTFAFPQYGLYPGEKLIFRRDSRGSTTVVEAAGIDFPRRPVGLEEGTTFHIDPVKPVAELRRTALAASPPSMPDTLLRPELTELVKLDTTLRLDIRYASTNNFVRERFYDQARAFMQRPAAEALVRAHRELKKYGYGILIHDAYRPWYVTKMFWDATPDDKKIFVADPSRGSIHNRGAAVDLTLYDLKTGKPVQTVSGYDEFSERAFPDYPGGTSHQRWLRELLRDKMEEQGFAVYPWEWWHFNYRDAARYPVLNLRFEEIR